MARTSNIQSVTRSTAAHSEPASAPEGVSPDATVLTNTTSLSSRVLTAKLNRVEALAMALDAASIEAFKADPVIVCRNAANAVAAMIPHRHTLALRMPSADWDLAFAAHDIADALLLVVERRSSPRKRRASIVATRDALQRLRAPALHIARGLAQMGILPIEDVERIEAGVGLVDMARDGIALAELFTRYSAAVRGMHPFTNGHIAQMEALGAELLRSVKPAAAPARIPAAPDPDAVLCDRLWTLLTSAHQTLREGAFLVWGEDYNQHVPTLRTYAHVSRARSARTAPPPAPTPA